MSARLPDLHVSGTLTADKFTPPSASVGDAAIRSGDYIRGDKIQHGIRQVLAQDSDSSAVDQTRAVHVAAAPGQLMRFEAGAVAANQDGAEVMVDLLKNGSSVLTAPITLDDSQADRQVIAGTISSETYSAGDVFEIVVTTDAGTGTLAQGVFAALMARENPQ